MPVKNLPSSYTDSEDIFLSEITKRYAFWKARAVKLEKSTSDATKERNYASAYQLLINQFSAPNAHDKEADK